MTHEIRTSDFVSFDGTRIVYQTIGPADMTPIVIVNGPGADYTAWNGFIREFSTDHYIVTWDYRGFFRSDRPSDRTSMAVGGHVRDLRQLLDHLGIEHAVFVSWSFGTQIQLEAYRQFGERFLAMIAVNGTYGVPFRRSPGVRGTSPLGLLRAILPDENRVLKRAVKSLRDTPAVLDVAQRLRLVSPSINRERFVQIAESFAELNHVYYREMLKRFAHHDADDLLPHVRCPALFFAGRRDPLVPSSYSRYMAERVPGAELLVIPIASHYIPVEFAEYLNLKVEDFLEEHLGPRPILMASE